jgi:hypothetical protein
MFSNCRSFSTYPLLAEFAVKIKREPVQERQTLNQMILLNMSCFELLIFSVPLIEIATLAAPKDHQSTRLASNAVASEFHDTDRVDLLSS